MIHQTPRTTTSRMPKRTQYDEELVNSILDEALFCTIILFQRLSFGKKIDYTFMAQWVVISYGE
jgi:hypothetical protein